MQSKAKSVAQYLAELPADRRRALEVVRRVILENLDPQYEEGMQYGMIGYYVPHRVYPAGYHCDPRQPLPFACLASQKNHMALYLTTVYMDGGQLAAFQKRWAQTGKRLDMGKSCIRFKKVEDLALNVIARAIREVPARKHIALYEKGLAAPRAASEPKAAKPKVAARPAKKAPAKAAKSATLKKSAKKKAAKRRA